MRYAALVFLALSLILPIAVTAQELPLFWVEKVNGNEEPCITEGESGSFLIRAQNFAPATVLTISLFSELYPPPAGTPFGNIDIGLDGEGQSAYVFGTSQTFSIEAENGEGDTWFIDVGMCEDGQTVPNATAQAICGEIWAAQTGTPTPFLIPSTLTPTATVDPNYATNTPRPAPGLTRPAGLPTFTPTATGTAAPTGTATATAVPVNTPTNTPTAAPTNAPETLILDDRDDAWGADVGTIRHNGGFDYTAPGWSSNDFQSTAWVNVAEHEWCLSGKCQLVRGVRGTDWWRMGIRNTVRNPGLTGFPLGQKSWRVEGYVFVDSHNSNPSNHDGIRLYYTVGMDMPATTAGVFRFSDLPAGQNLINECIDIPSADLVGGRYPSLVMLGRMAGTSSVDTGRYYVDELRIWVSPQTCAQINPTPTPAPPTATPAPPTAVPTATVDPVSEYCNNPPTTTVPVTMIELPYTHPTASCYQILPELFFTLDGSWFIPEALEGWTLDFDGIRLCIFWLIFPTIVIMGVSINPVNVFATIAISFVFSLFWRST